MLGTLCPDVCARISHTTKIYEEKKTVSPEGSVMACRPRGVSWRLARGECHGVSPEGSVMASRPRGVSWRLPIGECHTHDSLPVWTLADWEWRAAAPGLKPLHLPRAPYICTILPE